jgi:hypothetical protein
MFRLAGARRAHVRPEWATVVRTAACVAGCPKGGEAARYDRPHQARHVFPSPRWGCLTAKSVRPAAVDALNQAAEAGRLAGIEAMPAYLDRPTPYTTMGVGMTPASADSPRNNDLIATVRIKPKL